MGRLEGGRRILGRSDGLGGGSGRDVRDHHRALGRLSDSAIFPPVGHVSVGGFALACPVGRVR